MVSFFFGGGGGGDFVIVFFCFLGRCFICKWGEVFVEAKHPTKTHQS